ncbi:MAG: leucine-rich repeat protein, partial [Lachnospiraceae bacterium]|nr:leucine-rich repeat protein [Lachnospiraceae bacterium]
AFEYDKELTSVDTEATFEEIGDEAFYNCSDLTDFNINAVKIGKSAFEGDSSLMNVELKEGLESLGENAFMYVEASSEATHGIINIPSTLTSIGKGALDFNGVSGFVVSEANPNYSSVDGVLFDKSKKTLLRYPTGSVATSYTVPEGVETIGENAFSSAVLLTDVKLAKSTKKLEEGAFLSCESLKNINLDEGLTDIGVAAFASTGLENVVIPDSVTNLSKWAFGDCAKLKSATIGKGITEIPEGLFVSDTSLTELKLNEKIEKFNATALFGSTLTFDSIDFGGNTNFSVKDGVLFSADGKTLIAYPSIGEAVPDDIEYSDDIPYDGTPLEITDTPGNVSEDASANSREIREDDILPGNDIDIPYDDFNYNDYVKEYTVPDGVETIGAYAFAGIQDYINKIFIPASVKNFEYSSFGYKSSMSQYPYDSFGNSAVEGATIIAPAGSEAENYAKKNNFAFFTEDCSGNATEISMKMKDKKSYTIPGAVKGYTLYFSNDPEIAKINKTTGAITPVAKGTTTLVAATGTKYFSCTLNVTDGSAPKKTADKYTELKDYKSLKKWINTYMDYNNDKAFIKKHCPAIREYSGNDYSHIVAAFYDPSDYYFKSVMGHLGEDYKQYVKLASNLSYELRQAKSNTNLRMFRGTSYIGDITGGGSTVSDMVNSIGKTYVSTAVSSTSLLHEVATAFSGGGVVLEIEGDKDNIPGMYIASFSQYPTEAELLLANKTTYKVVDAGVRAYINDMGSTDYEKYIKLKIVK